jgi:hypothetical protein
MPELERMRPQLAVRGIDLIGINVDTERGANIKGYVANKRVTYPIVIGGVAAIENIYATDELSVPLTILVDDKGIVKELILGWSQETQRKFNLLVGGETVKSSAPMVPTKVNKKR